VQPARFFLALPAAQADHQRTLHIAPFRWGEPEGGEMAKQLSRQSSWLALPLLAVVVGPAAEPAVAQTYPSNTIRIVLSGPAGTPPDIITRIVANELGQSEGWRIVVENKPGAIGKIAAGEVLKQPADGHTIYGIALPQSAAPALLPDIGFRLDVDFAPVIKLTTSHHVLVVHPSVPAKSMAELVTLLKENPDKFTFSSGGFGTPAHLTGELFKLHTGVRAAHVPYRALPQAIADLVNGTNHYQFITALPVLDLIAAGKLRALAVTAPKRAPALKDVPSVVEEGFPQLVNEEWIGWLVKSGTPDAVIARLNEATNRALANPSVREAFAKISADHAGGSPAEFGAFLKSQIAHWGKVVKDAGIKIRE
jgi:tripartite-type tricarboxylate transporter receptor subunit TctC